MDLSLRSVSLDDVAYLLTLEADPAIAPYIRPWSRATHERELTNPNVRYQLAVDRSTAERVGFVVLRGLTESPKQIEFVRLAIGKRGCGYGRATVLAVLDWARALDCRQVWLQVFPQNDPARTLYASAGFINDGSSRSKRGFGGQPGEVLRMISDL